MSYEKPDVNGIELEIWKGLGLCIGLELRSEFSLGSVLIFRFSLQKAYLIYGFSVDGSEYKSHLKNYYAVTSGLKVSLLSHFQLETSLLGDTFNEVNYKKVF